MHVAMSDLLVRKQCANFRQFFDNERISFPNVQAAEVGQVCGINAIGLNRAQNVIDGETVLGARNEVVDSVGRGRVNDASTRIQRNLVGAEHWRAPVI